MRLIGSEMDQLQAAVSTAGALQAKGIQTEPAGEARVRGPAGDPGSGKPGKPVGAVVAASGVPIACRLTRNSAIDRSPGGRDGRGVARSICRLRRRTPSDAGTTIERRATGRRLHGAGNA